jgi:hypothetical protein
MPKKPKTEIDRLLEVRREFCTIVGAANALLVDGFPQSAQELTRLSERFNGEFETILLQTYDRLEA